jgi:Domain of unknown function (DUF4838)
MDDLTITPRWRIELRSDHPVARFAAEELRRTLQRIGGPALPVVGAASERRIALSHGAGGDGFVRAPDAGGLSLRGEGPRGLLYAVYELLEALGCQWVAPGPGGERLPRHAQLRLPATAVAQRPALAGRCLVLGHDSFLAQAEQWVIWAAQNRLSAIFIHSTPGEPALGACRLRSWQRRRAALLPLIRERGLELELGGHAMGALVPRRLFRSQPELFRFDGARRTPDHNLCASSPQALALLRAGGAAFFRAHPDADTYHLWPADLRDGGWCACPTCADLSPSDQALIAVNALAEALAEVRPTARISHLAYHDTDPAPAKVAPLPNVSLLYAPRPRSYAHGIGDPSSPLNRPFAASLAANLAAFTGGADADHPPPPPTTHHPAVFEYYLDGILFKGLAPMLGATMQADMRHYRAAGVHTVQALMTGFRPWAAAPPNAYLFARLAWDPEQPPAELLAAYAAARAPRSPAALAALWQTQERAWQAVLDRTPAEASEAADRRGDLVGSPPTDVLDYMAAPRPVNERRLERLSAAEAQLSAAAPAWQAVLDAAHADRPQLAAEQAEWELGRLVLSFLRQRQLLYVLASRKAERASLRAALAEARIALAAIDAWGHAQLSPGQPQRGLHLLSLFLGLQLDRLADSRLALPWQRLGLRLSRYTAVARALIG